MECGICVRSYDQNVTMMTPRILPVCGHTLCEQCVMRLEMNKKVVCPFDRKVTVLNDCVQNLPKNFAILDLLERTAAASAPPEEEDIPGEVREEVQVHEDDQEEDSVFLADYMYNLRLSEGAARESEQVVEEEEESETDEEFSEEEESTDCEDEEFSDSEEEESTDCEEESEEEIVSWINHTIYNVFFPK